MPVAGPRSLSVVFPASKNIQRLGSLAIVCKLASSTRATTLQDLGRNYRSLLTVPFTVPDAEHATTTKYLRKRNLLRKYKTEKLPLVIESQDWLLGDSKLPSRTGSEKEDILPTLDLAIQLGLLWPSICQRTWSGDLIAEQTGDAAAAFRSGDRAANPFMLSLSQRMIFAFVLIQNDRTATRFLTDLIHSSSRVDIPVLISKTQSGFDKFIESVRQGASGPDDAQTLKQLEELHSQLLRSATGRKSGRGGVTVQTLRRSYEEWLYWRLESLVDLGYLTKPDPDLYVYSVTPQVRALRDFLTGSFESSFFQHWWSVLGKRAHRVDSKGARDLLYRANQQHANQMGYSLIREGVLVSNLLNLTEHSAEVLELETAAEAIQLGSDGQYRVVTSVDRNRVVSAYKMVKL